MSKRFLGKLTIALMMIAFASEQVLETDGKVEEVRGPAAKRLREVGSVGALLRF